VSSWRKSRPAIRKQTTRRSPSSSTSSSLQRATFANTPSDCSPAPWSPHQRTSPDAERGAMGLPFRPRSGSPGKPPITSVRSASCRFSPNCSRPLNGTATFSSLRTSAANCLRSAGRSPAARHPARPCPAWPQHHEGWLPAQASDPSAHLHRLG
jgi:hypothetical protein